MAYHPSQWQTFKSALDTLTPSAKNASSALVDALQTAQKKMNGSYQNSKSLAMAASINSALQSAKDIIVSSAQTAQKKASGLYDPDGDGIPGFAENLPDAPVVSSGGRKTVPVYQDAPLAELYNMNSATAYQEALANTAHQREVRDLQAAGLNPVLSANGGSGASVFSGSSGSVSFNSTSNNSAKTVSALGRLIGSVVSAFNRPLGNAIKSGSVALGDLLK